ncbi:hypothetical protein PRIPAC_83798 [Pristionchus pacificus]|uniref:Uncharacterized protein n=1 Tax=Pristionchus pacificus TaxID=54126 RepID=A0A2A6BTV2_PRIPA|nr:hypothetical protein PRIPAC_83798 [Pristionchus pacificus]|eukprot:PDM69324.1 hypothetical protein PRIPAC_47626 [Pristionchus pacificus]
MIYDWNMAKTGGKPITAELDPERNYIIGSHPHGVLPIGACATFLTESTGFSKQFTGLTAKFVHYFFLLSMVEFGFVIGGAESSRTSLKWNLRNPGKVRPTCNSTLSLRNELFDQAAENDEQGVMRMQLSFIHDSKQLLTYEMAQKPHHIGVRKSWPTWHSQNLEGWLDKAASTLCSVLSFRQSQPLVVAQDEIVRRFISGFFAQNLVVFSNEYSNRLDTRRIYWMFGFAREFLSQLLKQPVKLKLAFVENEKDCAYNFI